MKTFRFVSHLLRCTVAFPLMAVFLLIHAVGQGIGTAIGVILPDDIL
jgi:hypothetical protein